MELVISKHIRTNSVEADLRMTMQIIKVMSKDQLTRQQKMLGNESLDRAEEYTNLKTKT